MTDSARLRLSLLRLLPQVGPGLTVATTLLVVVGAVLPVVFTVATGAIVGSVPQAIEHGLSSPQARRLFTALVVAGVAFLGQQVSAPVLSGLAEALGRRVDGALRLRAMRAALRPAGIAHLEDPEILDKAALARGAFDGAFTPGGAVLGLASNASAALASAGSGLLVARFNVPLALALVAAWRVVRMVLLRQFFAQIATMIGGSQHLRRSTYFRDLALTPGAAKETRIFGLGGWVGDRFTQYWMEGMREVWRTRRGGRLGVAAVIAGITVIHFVAFAVVGNAALDGSVALGELTVLLTAVIGVGNLSISDADLHIGYGLAALPALADLERETAAGDGEPGTLSLAAGQPRHSIRFEGVTFRYRGRNEPVLDGIDLEFPAGRSTAIVGENGAGKTTLVKLLARLYEPTGGVITVDSHPLRDIEPASWQRRVAAIFQDFIRYEFSVRDNVGFGAADRRDDDAAVRTALDRAGATTIVDALPNGIDTVLSRRFEGGADLSGGEWQRIALARALFAVDAGAGVLVLDEPTANLDVRAEAELYDKFLDLTRGLTTILISHRFSTVRRADRIVVIEGGRIVEQGDHDTLMQRRGRYAEMFSLQAARFVDDRA